MKTLLHGDGVTLRALEPEDLGTLYRWENDTALWATGSSIAPFSRKLLWEYIENYNPDIYAAKQLRLMIVLDATGEAIGTVDFYDFDPDNRRCGVGILIDRAFTRKGYGSQALAAATRYARGYIGMHQLWAIIPADNEPSLRLFARCGYKTCGRLRSWLRRGGSYVDAYVCQHLAAE